MPIENTSSPSAIRTRRYRERRDRGDIVISLEVENYKLRGLIDHGFLAEGDVTNRAKIAEAVDVFLFALADGAVEIDFAKYD